MGGGQEGDSAWGNREGGDGPMSVPPVEWMDSHDWRFANVPEFGLLLTYRMLGGFEDGVQIDERGAIGLLWQKQVEMLGREVEYGWTGRDWWYFTLGAELIDPCADPMSLPDALKHVPDRFRGWVKSETLGAVAGGCASPELRAECEEAGWL